MTRDDLIAVISELGQVLDANGGQRITEALGRGIMLVVEQRLVDRGIQEAPATPPPDGGAE